MLMPNVRMCECANVRRMLSVYLMGKLAKCAKSRSERVRKLLTATVASGPLWELIRLQDTKVAFAKVTGRQVVG